RESLRELEPDEWKQLHSLFAELIESSDPEAFLSQLNPETSQQLRHLWQQHQAATESGFMAVPVASVRSLRAPVPCFNPGQILAGRFRIERMLGGGGMGEVYLARDQRLNEERVAVKTIRRHLAAEPVIRQRFVAEVQNARRVTHPQVCRIFELF